ncbi:hypothetical protein Zm00014a_029339 [Zea mays]|jgi:hypothetical protein|uniref:OJ991113_30.9 protein n=2 Tax=Zea mays TaxID=4577 RepID=A0A1D6E7P2_MAIZE|nr:uncharacterized protein LOC100276993 [Zea mays]ONM16441.1 OJ991113_30.9 protein [Zea mays]PWZ36488.1 hypothetical protein Zm00014a_029339 [Zea mays]|eukprot:NP_001144142.2 uncharacterized protein LOC100276993 [Zea mays]
MADTSYWEWMGIEVCAVAELIVSFAIVTTVPCLVFYFGYNSVLQWWESPRFRILRLGGVTTLRQKLNYHCTLCQGSMEAGENVRKLSCNHVFHCDSSVKCEGVDQRLCTTPMTPWNCPICDQVLHPVLPWKRTPPPSPPPPQKASAAAQQQLPRKSSSTRDLEDPLLPRHGEKRTPRPLQFRWTAR